MSALKGHVLDASDEKNLGTYLITISAASTQDVTYKNWLVLDKSGMFKV